MEHDEKIAELRDKLEKANLSRCELERIYPPVKYIHKNKFLVFTSS